MKEELATVVVGAEDELAVIASNDDVIEPALDFKSWLAQVALAYSAGEGVANCILALVLPPWFSEHRYRSLVTEFYCNH